MIFDQYLGPETIEREYKIGAMELQDKISTEYIYSLLISGKWIFNVYIVESLRNYIKKYLPKYIAAFNNKRSCINCGEIYFGVDDKGFVKGIPYKGKLNVDFLIPLVNDILNKDLQFSNKRVRDLIKSKIRIELIPVVYNKNNKIEPWYNNFLCRFENNKNVHNKKAERREIWNRVLRTQTEKLYLILNREKHSYADYIKETRLITPSNYKHTYTHLSYLDLAGVPTYHDLLVELRTKEFKYTPGTILSNYREMVKGNQTVLKPSEINNCIILYTFGDYKDYCVKALKITKPDKIKKITGGGIHPKNLLLQLDKMTPIWIQNNRGITLSIIKITIPAIDDNVLYFSKKRKFESCYRTEVCNEPVTLSI